MQEGSQPGQDERGITNTSASVPELRNIVSPCLYIMYCVSQVKTADSVHSQGQQHKHFEHFCMHTNLYNTFGELPKSAIAEVKPY
jgi:hypothetical protein